MFKKIVSNLPYNPGLIAQVGFYADRLHREKSIRMFSFVFIALAMAVQSWAILSPSQPSLAASGNDIISGGVTTKASLLSAYDNSADIRAVYDQYNLTRSDLANVTDVNRVQTGSVNWYSMGRNSISNYSYIGSVYKNNEVKVQYAGENTAKTSDDRFVYQRQLRAWDTGSSSTYPAFKGTSSATGQQFWIIKSCGNLAFVDSWKEPKSTPDPDPAPEAKTKPAIKQPKLEIRKSISSQSDGAPQPGDVLNYRIEYRNNVNGTVAKDTYIEDQLDIKSFDYLGPNKYKNSIGASGFMRIPVGSLQFSTDYQTITFQARLKNPIPSPTKVCNSGRITSTNTGAVQSNEVCITVLTPCPFDSSVPDSNNPNCVRPKTVCELLNTAINNADRKATFKTSAISTNPALVNIKKYDYDFGDGTTASFNSDAFMNETMHVYAPGDYQASVTITYNSPDGDGEQTTGQTELCVADISFDEYKPLGQSKTVENITQDLLGEDAINSKVQAGDVLEYQLSTLNSQDYERTGILVTDYIGDILEYAELDLAHLEKNGGRFDEETKSVVFENMTIPGNSALESTFRVQLMNPIPATNRVQASGTNDCRIDNTYGNSVGMSVQCPFVKGIETLPNTGPGTSLVAGMSITVLVGYFFARARLMTKEMDYIRTDYVTTASGA